ncbi:MAG: hypothetical protein WC827_03820 [Candidatus Paceibacterota bacterium]|jgi:hypothetical protein
MSKLDSMYGLPLNSEEMKAKLIELLQNPETNIKNLMVIQDEIIIVFNNLPKINPLK